MDKLDSIEAADAWGDSLRDWVGGQDHCMEVSDDSFDYEFQGRRGRERRYSLDGGAEGNVVQHISLHEAREWSDIDWDDEASWRDRDVLAEVTAWLTDDLSTYHVSHDSGMEYRIEIAPVTAFVDESAGALVVAWHWLAEA